MEAISVSASDGGTKMSFRRSLTAKVFRATFDAFRMQAKFNSGRMERKINNMISKRLAESCGVRR